MRLCIGVNWIIWWVREGEEEDGEGEGRNYDELIRLVNLVVLLLLLLLREEVRGIIFYGDWFRG